MSTQKSRNKIIDKFNEILDKSNGETVAKGYSKALNTIQKQALSLIKESGNISLKQLREIINGNKIPSNLYNKSIVKSYLGSGVTLLIENPNMSAKDLKKLEPILGLVKGTGMNLFRIVRRIEKWSEIIIRDEKPVGKFSGAIISLKEYVGETNAKQIVKISRVWSKEIKSLNNKIETRLSRDIFTDLRKFQKSTTIFAEDGERLKVPRPLTQNEINEKLRKKYRNASTRVERIIRTEVSAQNELVRQLDAKTKGYDKKRWINEGDSKVRQSHKGQILQQRPLISEKFVLVNRKTGKSSEADYPKDPTLPVEERVNCRCTAAYTK